MEALHLEQSSTTFYLDHDRDDEDNDDEDDDDESIMGNKENTGDSRSKDK
jgi:hypothetical protein